jgi:hypothetical protein
MQEIHTVLSCIALLLFLGQGVTGSRDLWKIPVIWQQEQAYQCHYKNTTCPKSARPTPQSSPPAVN